VDTLYILLAGRARSFLAELFSFLFLRMLVQDEPRQPNVVAISQASMVSQIFGPRASLLGLGTIFAR